MPEGGRSGEVRIAYLDAQGGLAGDMLLGAALDAGLDPAVLDGGLAALGLEGIHLRVERVQRQGLSAVQVRVEGAEGSGRSPDTPARRLPEVIGLLARSGLPGEVVTAATAAFRRLAQVEGRIHGCAPEEVHFHEVGAVDSLVDIVGAFLAFRALGAMQVYGSEAPLGSGTVRTAHGTLPVPAPATLALLEGWPVLPGGPAGEVITPTGALLLTELCGAWRPCPPLRVGAVGYGAGHRDDPGRANVARLLVGEAVPAGRGRAAGSRGPDTAEPLLPGVRDEEVVVLEANVDDMTPEWCSHLMEALLAAGARDAAVTPLQMKKGRPGWLIMAVADPVRAQDVGRVFLKESTTLGLRYRRQRRVCLGRRFEEVEVAGEKVRVKVGLLGEERLNLAPEYEDCRRVAAATGLPLKEVYALAQAAVRGRETTHETR